MANLSEKITAEALSLPVDLRLALVNQLLVSLNVPTAPEIDRLWALECERRSGEVSNGTVELNDGEAVFQKLRDRIR